MLGEPQVVALPFKCLEDIVEWEIEGFEMEDDDFVNDTGLNQLNLVLLIQLVSSEMLLTQKKRGGMHILSSPLQPKQYHIQEDTNEDCHMSMGYQDLLVIDE